MKALLGYWLTTEAIIILVTIVIGGMEMDAKCVAGMILLMSVFITMLLFGAYLIGA